MKNTFYVTTPIYYSSGSPHLGHAYTSIACDILTRWNKNIGKETFFTTGNDDHGQKIVEGAQKEKISNIEFTNKYSKEFEELMKTLEIGYDYFVRTTNKEHKKFVQKMLQKSYENGDIYKGEYEGLYCVGCEKYYTLKDAVEGKCPVHKRELENLKEETYFFKLSKYQKKLLDLYKKNPEFLSPKSKSKEILNRVKEGLRDVSISRHKDSLDWGIELPFDKDHVTYVWFDALFNYLSSCNINKDKKKFWACDVHVVGSDIAWFHTVYWPAFLMSVGEELPKKVFSHGMVLDKEGHKMSKSLGNVIDPIEMIKKYGVDEFKYYLMSCGTFGEDLNISEEDFINKINNELNNDLGNLVSRVHAMTNRYFNCVVPSGENLKEADIKLIESLNIFKEFNLYMQDLEFNKALELLWSKIRLTNAYINEVAPWKEDDNKRLETIINTLVFAVKIFGDYIDCFMPNKAELLRKQYNFEKGNFSKFEKVKEGHKLGEKNNLFVKVKTEEKKEKAKVEVKKEGFSSLNLKVGKIIDIKDHPSAEKLYIEQIDVGEEKPRQIISGLKDYYTKEEMVGLKVIVVANLKPAKLRGELSEGMILAADDGENVGILTTDSEIGSNVSCGKEVANNKNRISVDDFFKIILKSKKDGIYYDNNKLTSHKYDLKVLRNVQGRVR